MKEKPSNLVFVDHRVWNDIEMALSPEVNAEFSETGYIRTQAVDGPMQKSWSSLVLKDTNGKEIYFVLGGIEAEKEYLEELQEC